MTVCLWPIAQLPADHVSGIQQRDCATVPSRAQLLWGSLRNGKRRNAMPPGATATSRLEDHILGSCVLECVGPSPYQPDPTRRGRKGSVLHHPMPSARRRSLPMQHLGWILTFLNDSGNDE
jgi:hypothetical protein